MNSAGDSRPSTSGVVTLDLLGHLSAGTTISFETLRFPISCEARLNSIENWNIFDGTLLAIHCQSISTDVHIGQDTIIGPQEEVAIGSAVIVAPGIAISAKHVVEPLIPEILSSAISCYCTAIAKSSLMIWKITKITLRDNTDLAFLSIEAASDLPEGGVYKKVGLSTRLPEIGELVAICGFVSKEIVTIGDAVGGNVFVSTGVVGKRFAKGRNSVMLPWPVFQVDCDSIGGMSGGSVFDRDGLLVGLIGSGISGGTSYVTLLFPALHAKCEPTWPPGLRSRPISLMEMERDLCYIDRREAVSLIVDEDTSHETVRYEFWS